MKVLFVIHGPRNPATAAFATLAARVGAFERAGNQTETWTPDNRPAWPGRHPLELTAVGRLRGARWLALHSMVVASKPDSGAKR